jgi:site-specific recombinase XerD
MKQLLKEQIPKQNTFETYYRYLTDVYNYFKLNNINELLTTKEAEIIEYIEKKYDNNSTIKTKLCCINKCYKILKIESELFKNKIDEYKLKTTLTADKTKDTNKIEENEGNKMIEDFKKHYENLEEKIKNDLSILTEWKQEAQLYCILKLYLEYGVLRSSEIINCLITDNDDKNTINYINIKS